MAKQMPSLVGLEMPVTASGGRNHDDLLAIRMGLARPGSRSRAIRSICHGGCLSGGMRTRRMRPRSSSAPVRSLQAEALRARCLRWSTPSGARAKISWSRHTARALGDTKGDRSRWPFGARGVLLGALATTISVMTAQNM